MKKQLILVSITLVALVGCGSPKSKLSAEQTSKLNDTLTAIGRIERASTNTRAVSASTLEDDSQTKMAKRLSAAACAVDFQSPNSGSTSFNARLKVDGRTCPVLLAYQWSMDTDMIGGKLSFNIDASYKVLDPEYQRLNDIDSLTMKGGFKAERDASNSSMTLSGSIDGKVHSQKSGDIAVAMKVAGDQTKDDAEVTETITFTSSDYEAEFRTRVSGSSQKYYLNDEEISLEAYKGYLTKAGTLFQTSVLGAKADPKSSGIASTMSR